MNKLAILFAILALAACASDDKAEKKESKRDEKPPVAKLKVEDLICPQVAVLQEAQEMFDYGGEKPDPAQLVAKARMRKIDGDCAYRKSDDDKKGDTNKDGIDIAFTLHLEAARGPRLGGSQASFPYFIAVVDPAEKILSRQVITAQFKFSGSDKVSGDDEKMHVFIPLPGSAQQVGPDYRVLVGFRLTPEQTRDQNHSGLER